MSDKTKHCPGCDKDKPASEYSGAQFKMKSAGLCKECVVSKEAKKNVPRGKAAVAAAASSSSPPAQQDQDQDAPAAACAGCGKAGEFSIKCPICVELHIESRFCNKKCLALKALAPAHQKVHDEAHARQIKEKKEREAREA